MAEEQRTKIKINRAPVMTLWAAVVAGRLGYDRDLALTLGRAVAGMNAQSKGRRLGIYPEPGEAKADEDEPEESAKERGRRAAQPDTVELLGRAVPVVQTPQGLRAAKDDKPTSPGGVERYLAQKFGDHLEEVRAALEELAASLPPADLARRAYDLYEQFRPAVPEGQRGWGAAGELDLGKIHKLAARR